MLVILQQSRDATCREASRPTGAQQSARCRPRTSRRAGTVPTVSTSASSGVLHGFAGPSIVSDESTAAVDED